MRNLCSFKSLFIVVTFLFFFWLLSRVSINFYFHQFVYDVPEIAVFLFTLVGEFHQTDVTANCPVSWTWALGDSALPSPSLECALCHSGSHFFLGCSLEIVRCWDHLDSGCDWTPTRLLYKLSRFGRWVQRSIHLTAPKTSLVCHFPWLLNYHLPIWSGLPLSSVSPWLLCIGTISDSTWGSPRLQTNIMLFHLPWKLFLQAHFMPGNIFLFSSDRWNIISWGLS